MRLTVKLHCVRTARTTTVRARPPAISAGMWVISERARRAACKRLGADWSDPNPKIHSSATVRAVDKNGYHTFTIYPAPAMKPFAFGDWHAWEGVAQIMLSDESVKKLRAFDSTDDCINWLYLNGHKDAARALNAHVKG